MKEIELVIAPDGSVHVETRGLVGEECVVETDALAEALGALQHRELKREYRAVQGKAGTAKTRTGR